MIFLQVAREAIEVVVSERAPNSMFSERMITMSTMAMLTFVIVFYARFRKISLPILPKKFGKGYMIYTCIIAVLLFSSPSIYTQGYQAIWLLVYGSVVTPVYEELIFRGYIWNRLNQVMAKETSVYAWSVVLFILWHLGYMIPQIISGNWIAVLWKLAAGAGYGAVLGFVRLHTKNCYSTILLHGVLNNFMI